MTAFHVVTSCAKMPAKVKVPYRHVAVIETQHGYVPSRIDSRPTNVVRIVSEWRNLHLGFNPRGNTAAERALREAHAEASALNAGRDS